MRMPKKMSGNTHVTTVGLVVDELLQSMSDVVLLIGWHVMWSFVVVPFGHGSHVVEVFTEKWPCGHSSHFASSVKKNPCSGQTQLMIVSPLQGTIVMVKLLGLWTS